MAKLLCSFLCLECFILLFRATGNVVNLTAGEWTVGIADNGNIVSVRGEGSDMLLQSHGGCLEMKLKTQSTRKSNSPVIINGNTKEAFVLSSVARCNAPPDATTRRSFCFDLGSAFGSNSRVQVLYNITLARDERVVSGFSLLQDIALNVTGDDVGIVVVVQLPIPIQPNRLVQNMHFIDTQLAGGHPFVRQAAGIDSPGYWAGEFSMSESPFMTDIEENTNNRLALPLVSTFSPSVRLRASHVADPYYSTAFKFSGDETGSACWQSVHNSSRSSLNGSGVVKVTRHFATVVHAGSNGWAGDVEAWYATALPHLQKPPEWTRKIALTHFDFYTKNGSAWRTDIDWLSSRLTVAERKHVVIAQEGWYDTQWDYSYDDVRNTFLDSWTFAPASPHWVSGANGTDGHWNCSVTHNSCDSFGKPKIWAVDLNVEKVKENLRYAKSKGFRVLLYFGDGLLVCKAAKSYDPSQTLPDALFQHMTSHMADCPCAPNEKYCNSVLNPLHPDVVGRFIRYLKALLKAFGDVIDGFVWDETFYIGSEIEFVEAAGGYASTQMLRLVEQLTTIVVEYNPEMVFMVSDIPSIFGCPASDPCVHNATQAPRLVPYGVVSSGQFPDFEVNTEVYPWYAATVSDRAAIWSCNWEPTRLLPETIAAASAYGLPPSLGMTYHTSQYPNVGIAGMAPQDSDTIIRLFRRQLHQNATTMYI